MKIAFYDPYLDSMSGGEKYILTAALNLSKDHEVYVFWDRDSKSIKEKAKERFDFDLDKVKFIRNIFNPRISIFKRLVLSRKYDVIIYLSDGSLPFVLTKKLIIHFQFPVEWVKNSFLTKIKLRKINKVICNSQFTKKYIDQKFNIKSFVIYPPCQLAEKIDLNKENMILTIGRFSKNINGENFKKHDFLIETFKKMIDKGLKNWFFHVAVSFKEEDRVEISKLNDLAKGYPIRIYENIKDSQLKDQLLKAKIYWHASGFKEDLKTHPELAEHFGISTVEAMSAGAVGVVINAGGQIEIVDDSINGFLWETQEQLIKKTEELIKNKQLLNNFSIEAIKKSQDFSLNVFSKKIIQALE